MPSPFVSPKTVSFATEIRLAQESSSGALESAKACDELSAMAAALERIFGQFTLRNSNRDSFRLSSSNSTNSRRPEIALEKP
jgi:hypothetical protein